MSRPSRTGRLLRGVGLTAMALVGAMGVATTPWGEEQTASLIRTGLEGVLAPGWTVDPFDLSLGLRGRVVLTDVGLRAPDGRRALSIRRIDMDLRMRSLWTRTVQISQARVDGVVFRAEVDDEGVLDWVRAFGGPWPETEPDPSATPWEGLPVGVSVDDLAVRDVQVLYRGAADVGEDGVPRETGVQLVGGWLESVVRVPRGVPEVDLGRLSLGGTLVGERSSVLGLDGAAVWRGNALVLDGVGVQITGTQLTLDGRLEALDAVPQASLTLHAEPLDLGALDPFLGIGLDGTYQGTVQAHGPLSGLALDGVLTGVGDTTGRLALSPGSVLCLPMPYEGPDPCGVGSDGEGIPEEELDLRWTAALDIDAIDVNQLFPFIGAPIVLDGRFQARGQGTTWPDGVVAEGGRWDAGEMDIYGVPVRSLGADLSLENGVLSMSDLDVVGVAGAVRGTGTLDLTTLRLELDAHGPLDLSMLEDLEVPGLRGIGTYQATLRGDLAADGVPIDVTGRVSMQTLSWFGDVALRDVQGPLSVRVVDGRTTVEGQGLTGEVVDAYGAQAGSLRLDELEVIVDDAVRVMGQGVIPRLTYGDLAWFEDVGAAFYYIQEGDDPMQVDVQATTGPHALVDLPGTQGNVAVQMLGDEVDLDVHLRRDDKLFLRMPSFHMDLATQEIEAEHIKILPAGVNHWSSRGPVSLRLVDGGVRDAQVVLASKAGVIEVVGAVGTEGRLGGLIKTEDLDLAALARMYPDVLGGVAGELDMQLALRGRASKPEIDLNLNGEGLVFPDVVKALDVDGKARVRDDVVTLDVAVGVEGDPLARFDGFVPVVSDLAAPGLCETGLADLEVVVEPGTHERFETLLGDLGLPDGVVSGVIKVDGDLRDPELDMRLTSEVTLEGLTRPARVEAQVSREQGHLDAVLDVYEGHRPVVRLDGAGRTRFSEVMAWVLGKGPRPDFEDVAVFADEVDIDGDLLDLSVSSILELLDLDVDLSGALTGHLGIHGHVLEPDLDVDVKMDGVAGGVPVTLSTAMHPSKDGGYGLMIDVGDEEATWTSVTGHLPLRVDLTSASIEEWATGSLDLEVRGPGVPLGVAEAVLSDLDVARGVVELTGHVRGEVFDPRPDVAIIVRDVEAVYRPWGIRVVDMATDAHILEDPARPGEPGALLVDVAELTAGTVPVTGLAIGGAERSRVSISGQAGLDFGQPERIDLSADLNRAWIARTPDVRLQSTGDLKVTGTWPDLTVGGDLTVDQGYFVIDARQLMETRDLRVDRRIRIHRDGAATQIPEPEDDEPSLSETMQLALRLGLWGNVSTRLVIPVLDDLGEFGAQLTRLEVQTDVSGDLDVRGLLSELSIAGELEIPDGTARLLQARFELDSNSRLEFTGSDYLNPRIALGGRMNLTAGAVRLDIGGTANDPTMDLSSEEFTSDAELFTVLLTGKAPEELTAEQGRAAIEAVGDMLLNSILGGGDFGSVSVASDGTVRVGVPVGRSVFVETSFDPVPALNENQVTVEAEVGILPRLVFDAAYGDRRMWASLFWETRF